MSRLPIIEVDMGAYGKQEIDFNAYLNISTDYISELHKDASNYAYIVTVEKALRKMLKIKEAEFENIKGTLTDEVTEELIRTIGKATVTAISAKLASDDTVMRYKQEILEMDSNVGVVTGMLSAMSMRHSDLKKLVEIQLAEGRMGNMDVKMPDENVQIEPRNKAVRGSKIKKEKV
jgi:hypothetical protein